MSTVYKDQMGRGVELSHSPKRIISLVPSQTELLHHLGLEEEVIGITKFCIHPDDWFRNKTRIGGTKQINFDRIKALQPDLIIGNKEENDQSQIEQLAKEYPVWMSDIIHLGDALAMIAQIGKMTNTQEKSQALNLEISKQFDQLKTQKPASRIKTAYFIWRKPYMVAGAGTFINNMLEWAGFENIFQDSERYPQIELEHLNNYDLDAILLSSEPFPFKEKHLEEFQKICPKVVIKLVDGELFSWYGNRLLLSAAYFSNLSRDISRRIS